MGGKTIANLFPPKTHDDEVAPSLDEEHNDHEAGAHGNGNGKKGDAGDGKPTYKSFK